MTLLLGSENRSAFSSEIQTGPSVNAKPSATLKIFGFGPTMASRAGSFRTTVTLTSAGVIATGPCAPEKNSSFAERTQMKFVGGADRGQLTPKRAIWIF
jgi:hypothetical protein